MTGERESSRYPHTHARTYACMCIGILIWHKKNSALRLRVNSCLIADNLILSFSLSQEKGSSSSSYESIGCFSTSTTTPAYIVPYTYHRLPLRLRGGSTLAVIYMTLIYTCIYARTCWYISADRPLKIST